MNTPTTHLRAGRQFPAVEPSRSSAGALSGTSFMGAHAPEPAAGPVPRGSRCDPLWTAGDCRQSPRGESALVARGHHSIAAATCLGRLLVCVLRSAATSPRRAGWHAGVPFDPNGRATSSRRRSSPRCGVLLPAAPRTTLSERRFHSRTPARRVRPIRATRTAGSGDARAGTLPGRLSAGDVRGGRQASPQVVAAAHTIARRAG